LAAQDRNSLREKQKYFWALIGCIGCTHSIGCCKLEERICHIVWICCVLPVTAGQNTNIFTWQDLALDLNVRVYGEKLFERSLEGSGGVWTHHS